MAFTIIRMYTYQRYDKLIELVGTRDTYDEAHDLMIAKANEDLGDYLEDLDGEDVEAFDKHDYKCDIQVSDGEPDGVQYFIFDESHKWYDAY